MNDFEIVKSNIHIADDIQIETGHCVTKVGIGILNLNQGSDSLTSMAEAGERSCPNRALNSIGTVKHAKGILRRDIDRRLIGKY